MRFLPTPLAGAWIVETDAHADERGYFARAFCIQEFQQHGLVTAVAQVSLSFNHRCGTLRGLHYQVLPAAEAKVVRCIAGAIYDVIVDFRPTSSTFLQHVAVELTASNRRAMYVPPMCAHGFQTLTDEAEVLYLISAPHAPEHERGLRFDDPALAISWPLPVEVISARDTCWPWLDRAAVPPEER